MEISHRIVFTYSANTGILSFLEQNMIKYKYNCQLDTVVVNISESSASWPALLSILPESRCPSHLLNAVYSQDEMNGGEWYACRSKWRWEYPQPKAGEFGYMKNITYKYDSGCRECGCGQQQIGDFRVRKAPVWGGKNFLMLNWEEDVLFLTDHAKEILSASGLKGFAFRDVYDSKGQKRIENINQLTIAKYTGPGLVWRDNKTVKEISVCGTCGSTKYILSGRGYSYKRDSLPDDVDIVKSIEGFGFGAAAPSLIFISKKFYDIILKHNLQEKLECEPLMLV